MSDANHNSSTDDTKGMAAAATFFMSMSFLAGVGNIWLASIGLPQESSVSYTVLLVSAVFVMAVFSAILFVFGIMLCLEDVTMKMEKRIIAALKQDQHGASGGGN